MTPAEFVDNNNDERIVVGGTWRQDGSGALHVTATHVFLDTLQAAFDRADALRRRPRFRRNDHADTQRRSAGDRHGGHQQRPRRARQLSEAGRPLHLHRPADSTSTSGSIRRRASGSPRSARAARLFNRAAHRRADRRRDQVEHHQSRPDRGRHRAWCARSAASSRIDVRAIGTSRDPHVDGTVDIAQRGVPGGGERRQRTRTCAPRWRWRPTRSRSNRCTSRTPTAHSLDVHGSLGTHELRVGDLEIEVTAHRFEVMRNEFGRVDVDATLADARPLRSAAHRRHRHDQFRRRCRSTRFSSAPCSSRTRPRRRRSTDVDAVAALNPWDRLGLDLFLHVPSTLRLAGDNVQVSPGTPIGLGDINLRVTGDLYLYKDPAEPLYAHRIVRLDHRHLRVPGTPLRCRSRRARSTSAAILNPEIYVTVQPRHLRRRNAREHLRAAAGAGAAAGEHAAARSVGHPVADPLQHVDQPAVGGAAAGAGGPRRHARGRVPRAADPHGDRERARPRHLRDRARASSAPVRR